MAIYTLGKKTGEYEIAPRDSRKSFYGKARVGTYESGARVLYSYNTPVIAEIDGEYIDLWGDWTATTGRHIASFCGLNKAQVMELKLGRKKESDSHGVETIVVEE